jgi:hypothetical protein
LGKQLRITEGGLGLGQFELGLRELNVERVKELGIVCVGCRRTLIHSL